MEGAGRCLTTNCWPRSFVRRTLTMKALVVSTGVWTVGFRNLKFWFARLKTDRELLCLCLSCFRLGFQGMYSTWIIVLLIHQLSSWIISSAPSLAQRLARQGPDCKSYYHECTCRAVGLRPRFYSHLVLVFNFMPDNHNQTTVGTAKKNMWKKQVQSAIGVSNETPNALNNQREIYEQFQAVNYNTFWGKINCKERKENSV